MAFDFNGRGIDNYQPSIDFLSTFAQPFYDNNTMREYRYYRYRYGYSGSADYKFNDVSSIFIRGFYSQLKDWGDKWYYRAGIDRTDFDWSLSEHGSQLAEPKVLHLFQAPQCVDWYVDAGRERDSLQQLVDLGRAVSRSFEQEFGRQPKADFAWIGPSLQCNYRPRARPCSRSSVLAPELPRRLRMLSDFVFKDITYPDPKGLSTQLNLTGEISYAHNYTTHGHFGAIEAGYKISNAHKLQDETETVYDGWGQKPTNRAFRRTPWLRCRVTSITPTTSKASSLEESSDRSPTSTRQRLFCSQTSRHEDGYKTALAIR